MDGESGRKSMAPRTVPERNSGLQLKVVYVRSKKKKKQIVEAPKAQDGGVVVWPATMEGRGAEKSRLSALCLRLFAAAPAPLRILGMPLTQRSPPTVSPRIRRVKILAICVL